MSPIHVEEARTASTIVDRVRARGPRLARLAGRLGRALVDLVYPPSCLVCQTGVSDPQGLCPTCWNRMEFIERPFCERTGAPFPHDLGAGLLSPSAVSDPPVFGAARAVARYDDGPARQLVHALKYGDRTELARPLGRWMARAGQDLIAEADLLVPVPLHWTRLLRRRFNQAAELSREISRVSGKPQDPLALARVKPTHPQVGLTKPGRAANVQGAFKVPTSAEALVFEKKILLIDDVLTSGATLNAASRALLRAGAAGVDALVFARVVNGR